MAFWLAAKIYIKLYIYNNIKINMHQNTAGYSCDMLTSFVGSPGHEQK